MGSCLSYWGLEIYEKIIWFVVDCEGYQSFETENPINEINLNDLQYKK
jgi:hypothetical protein